MKAIFFLFVIALFASVGYLTYRGLTGDNDNAGLIANDIGNLSESVAHTVKDGAADIAKDIQNKAVEAKDSAVEKVKSVKDETAEKVKKQSDSAKSTVSARIGDIRQKAKDKMTK